MNVSNPSAAELVRAYLHGRSMDDGLFDAVVWMAAKRQASGSTPVLDQRLRMDIDSQAHGRDVVGDRPGPGPGVGGDRLIRPLARSTVLSQHAAHGG